MWSPGACGVVEMLVVGVGQSEEDISPSCFGLTLLTLTAWLTPTAASIWKGPQCCAASGGLLPSPFFSLSIFPSCCFSVFAPTISFASEARRFHSIFRGELGDSQTKPFPFQHPPFSEHSLSCTSRPDRGHSRPFSWRFSPGLLLVLQDRLLGRTAWGYFCYCEQPF